MLRFRRYRVFLVFAFITLAALYHFTTVSDWEHASAASVDSLRHLGGKKQSPTSNEVESGIDVDASKEDKQSGVAKSNDPPILKLDTSSTLSSQASTTTVPAEPETSTLPLKVVQDELATPSRVANTPYGEGQSSAPMTTEAPSSMPVASSSRASKKTLDIDEIPQYGAAGKGKHEGVPDLSNKPPIHWTRMPDHFPVPSDRVIPLPTGAPEPIPKIQFDFKQESPEARVDRKSKLGEIKAAFMHAWKGYKEKAWLQDELKPVSGKFKNPFCSWAATLVDSLDTLWIMGLEDEFDEAVLALAGIDFTTSPRKDIPVFETTIRYLGGLLSAYDLSNGRYKTLLDKAVELADVLMGAFDTPNRMPISFYWWAPTFATNPHRASTRTVMAELGSLSVEFTRLAQITKEPRYYDAIARITNELEAFQMNTTLPGLWPTHIDTSGCMKPTSPGAMMSPSLYRGGPLDAAEEISNTEESTPESLSPVRQESGNASMTQGKSKGGSLVSDNISSEKRPQQVEKFTSAEEADELRIKYDSAQSVDKKSSGVRKEKRQVALERLEADLEAAEKDPYNSPMISHNDAPEKVDCQPQGLASPPSSSTDFYTLGGQADSTYEYLPKMHMLLGGRVKQYRTMYNRAIDAANKHLLFRIMTEKEKRVVLSLGQRDMVRVGDDYEMKDLIPEVAHLTCFAGGMWGIGSKIFGREKDLEYAKQLTDGCVWAYEITGTGIMPEVMFVTPCDNLENCPWNQTFYEDRLDPFRKIREENRKEYEEQLQEQVEREEAATKAKGFQKQNDAYGSVTEDLSSSDTISELGSKKTQGRPATDISTEPEEGISSGNAVKGDAVMPKNQLGPIKPSDEELSEAKATTKAASTDKSSDVSTTETSSATNTITNSYVPNVPGTENPVHHPDSKNHAKRELLEEAPASSNSTSDWAPSETPKGASKDPDLSKEDNSQKEESGEEPVEKAPISQALPVKDNEIFVASGFEEEPIDFYPPHEKFVKDRIKNERLPKSVTGIKSTSYLLRPEAIESVFIMYRITGDEEWRMKGWKMFKAIKAHTTAEYGNSAIRDVTDPKREGNQNDSMESFWLAETLKYFYLLFSEPSKVSLDEYILNTEAHPMKRPKSA